MRPYCLAAAAAAVVPMLASAAPDAAPTGLMVELLARPELVAIRDPKPELSWIVNAPGRDEVQTAYQVRVAPTRDGLEKTADRLWDSGRVASDRSVAVEYAGKPLAPGREYWWQVRTWGRRGKPGGWSEPQRFRTADYASRSGSDEFSVDRYPLAQTEVAPVEVREVEPGHAFLDFGRDAYAALKLTLTGRGSDQTVVVHLGERLEAPGKIHRKPGGSIRYLRSELTLEPGTRTYTVLLTPKDARNMPPEIGPVMPFRYVEVEGLTKPLAKADARQVTVHYPFDDSAASFECSDPKLNAVWELCRYSMKATSFCGVYVDGDRERLPYEADAYINQLGHYAADREFTLARYSHEYLLQHPTWPTEWALHSPLMAWADYMQTGDRESLALFYDLLKAKTLRSLARPDGLITTVEPKVTPEILASVRSPRMQDIVDWPLGERDGYEMRPVNTVVNAFHYAALDRMAQAAAALGKTDDAVTLRQQAERVRTAINGKLFDAATGLYVDGEGSRHSSLHANMFPLALGVVPPARVKKVAESVRSKGMDCSVYGAQFLLEALYDAGLARHARELMTAPGDRSFRHMVEDVGTTITLEAWDNKYKPNQDWNHAWGAAPANILPRKLMGVEPLEPGFRTVRIRPQLGGLEWARMTVPTIRGPIRIDARDGGKTLKVTLPANTTAAVYLPLGAGTSLIVDGKKRKASVEGDFLLVDGVGSGEHTLRLHP